MYLFNIAFPMSPRGMGISSLGHYQPHTPYW
nr:MAG TPA: hypothetical protein [Caudoviricetes sp.]